MRLHHTDTRAVLRSSGRAAVCRFDFLRATPPGAAHLVIVLLVAAVGGGSSALASSAATLAAGRDVPAVESAPPDDARRQRVVFVCEDGGVPAFSDRPCGSSLLPRTLEVGAPTSGAAASTVPSPPPASTRPRPQPDGRVGPGRAAETRCSSLQRQLDELDDRMRAGYTSREAARLWNRWRDLKSRLRTAGC